MRLAPNLSAAERARLVRLLGMLGSDFDGERVNAAQMASKLLKVRDLTWDEVIAAPRLRHQASQDRPPQPDAQSWRADLALCRRHPNHLNPWEGKFCRSLAVARTSLTRGQATKLAQIADHLRAKGLA